jgi:hypothetical protein
MNPWKVVDGSFENIRIIEKRLLETIHDAIPELKDQTDGNRTKILKYKLINLADEFNSKVYANNLGNYRSKVKKQFIDTEFMFDLHWYDEPPNTDFQTLNIRLAMECEWSRHRKIKKTDNKEKDRIKKQKEMEIDYTAVKYDFQKLTLVNPEISLMIFKILRLEHFEKMFHYFQETIENCKQTNAGSRYLIIAYYNQDKNWYFFLKEKGIMLTTSSSCFWDKPKNSLTQC